MLFVLFFNNVDYRLTHHFAGVGVDRRGDLLGRLVGLVWALGLGFFWLTGRVGPGWTSRLLTLGLLGGLAFALLYSTFGVPLAVLAFMTAVRSVSRFLVATFLIALIGGGLVWLFGRGGSTHLGASELVFGYLAYLLGVGWWERTPVAIGVAVAAFALYGGILWGVLPGNPYVSWEAHLFGFLAGLLAAALLLWPARARHEVAVGLTELPRRRAELERREATTRSLRGALAADPVSAAGSGVRGVLALLRDQADDLGADGALAQDGDTDRLADALAWVVSVAALSARYSHSPSKILRRVAMVCGPSVPLCL